MVTIPDKIIAKMLSRLVRGVLHETINISQRAFVEGRQISNSVLAANKVMDEKRCLRGGFFFEDYFEKA